MNFLPHFALCMAILMPCSMSAEAQTNPPPKPGKGPPATTVAACDRVNLHLQHMADHMKFMGGGGMGCGMNAGQGPQAGAGRRASGECMGRMSDMMRDMAPLMRQCDRMTPDMIRRLERHEKRMESWQKPPAN